MGFKDILIGVFAASLFIVALLTFGTYIAIDNNANSTIIEQNGFSALNSTLRDNLRTVEPTVQSSQGNFSTQTPNEDGGETLGLATIYNVVTTFISLPFVMIGAVTKLLQTTFQIDPLVTSIFGGAFIIILVILGWRVIRSGGT